MKKLLLIILLITTGSISNAQNALDLNVNTREYKIKKAGIELPDIVMNRLSFTNDKHFRSALKNKNLKSKSELNLLEFEQKLDSLEYVSIGETDPNSKDICMYDNSGNILEIKFESFEDGDWITDGKKLFLYDDSGQMIKLYTLYFNYQQETLDTSDVTEYTYNENGQLLTERYSYFFENVWHKAWEEKSFYDETGKVFLINGFDFSEPDQTWQLSWKNEFTYNESGSILFDEFYVNPTNWILASTQSYTYNENNKLIIFLVQVLDESAGELINSLKSEFEYDENNNPISEIRSLWEGEWVFWSKSEFTYETGFTMENLILPFDDFITEVYFKDGKMLTSTASDWEDNSWVEFEMVYLNYSNFIAVGINETNQIKFSVYPNPSSDRLTIKNLNNDELEIWLMSIDGRVLLKDRFINNIELNVSDIPSGMYLVRVIDNRGLSKVEKILVNH